MRRVCGRFAVRTENMLAIDLTRGQLAGAWRLDPCNVLYELALQRPGENVALHIGVQPILLVQDFAATTHVLKGNQENYRKNLGGFTQFFGASRLTSDGQRWRMLQRLSQPHISGTDPAEVTRTTNRIYERAISEMLAAATSGGSVQVDTFIDRAAASVIAEVTLGFGPDDLGPGILDDFRTILRYANLVTWNLPGTVPLDDLQLKAQAQAASARIRGMVTKLIEARRVAGRNAEEDLLTHLASIPEGEIDLVGEISTLLFAGFDTTAATLSWAMLLLANSPTVQDTLRSEITREIGDRPPAPDDFDRLESLSAFVEETFRIFPAIPLLSRIAAAPDELDGISIAPGQRVLISVIGLHMNRRFFPNPMEVVLSRASNIPAWSEAASHIIPFGMGQRMCGGPRIARAEIMAALVNILQKTRIGLEDTGPIQFEWHASLRRKGGQRLVLEPTASTAA